MIGTLIPRLNQSKDAQNWLSMQPNPLRYSGWSEGDFGEVNKGNNLHGRCIQILNDGWILIGYFEDGLDSTGNYITIWSDGVFRVGEKYWKDGRRWERVTTYKKNGKKEQYEN